MKTSFIVVLFVIGASAYLFTVTHAFALVDSRFSFFKQWNISSSSDNPFVFDNTTVNFTIGRTIDCASDVRLYQNINGTGFQTLLFNATGKFLSGGNCLGAVYKTTPNVSSNVNTTIEIDYGNTTSIEQTPYFDVYADDFNRLDQICTFAGCIVDGMTGLPEDKWVYAQPANFFGIHNNQLELNFNTTGSNAILLHNFTTFPSLNLEYSFDMDGCARYHAGLFIHNWSLPLGINWVNDRGGGAIPACNFNLFCQQLVTFNGTSNLVFANNIGCSGSGSLRVSFPVPIIDGNNNQIYFYYTANSSPTSDPSFIAAGIGNQFHLEMKSSSDSPQSPFQNLVFDDLCISSQSSQICSIVPTTKSTVSNEFAILTLAQRVSALENQVSILENETQSLQNQVTSLNQTVQIIRFNITDFGVRISSLESLTQTLSAGLNSLTQSFNSFVTKIIIYLTTLPPATRDSMVCSYMFNQNLTTYSDLGLNCTISAGKCKC